MNDGRGGRGAGWFLNWESLIRYMHDNAQSCRNLYGTRRLSICRNFDTPAVYICAAPRPFNFEILIDVIKDAVANQFQSPMVETILNQGYGYGIILGLGFAFAFLMIVVTYVLKRFVGEVQDSEHFSTASRSVKTGLVASAVTSSWTWPGTLLTSAGMAYQYGAMGCYAYASAFTIQITFFAIIALQIKRVAPGAHTVVEIIRARYGTAGHLVYLFYALGANIIISAMLLLGGSQAISSVTGVHVVACGFLLPLGVIMYTLTGGIKATFLTDWVHTVIVYIVILVTMFVCYTSSQHIGSIDRMYDLLTNVAVTHPSTGYQGSYLTFGNKDGIFNMWNIVIGGFVTVFSDPSYGQKAIAAKPIAAMKGYFIGGLCWMVIPWAMGSAAALACLALTDDPISVSYPDMLSSSDVAKGLPLLYGMYNLMGAQGANCGVLILFMAATSATSAELIAFSSVMTYDVYRTYLRPAATGKEIVRVTHIFVIVFGICMGGVAVIFNYIGITISWILNFLGIVLGPSVCAIVLALFWTKFSKPALIWGSVLGTVSGILTWVGSAYVFSAHVVNKDTLNVPKADLVGNFVSLFSSLIYFVIFSYIWPDHYDFADLDANFIVGDDASPKEAAAMEVDVEDAETLRKALKFTQIVALVIFVAIILLFPLPLYGTNYIFSKAFFRGWIVVLFIWLILAACFITFYPIFESRETLLYLMKLALGKEKVRIFSENGDLEHGSKESSESVQNIPVDGSPQKN